MNNVSTLLYAKFDVVGKEYRVIRTVQKGENEEN